MSSPPTACPACGAAQVGAGGPNGGRVCRACGHAWTPIRLFLSYGRRDAREVADRLRADLEARGFEVWQDTRRIHAGGEWERQIEEGLRGAQLVIALLSPHAVRVAADPNNPDRLDSVCLDEISFARFARPPKPIVPAMVAPCEPPFCIFRLDYVDLCTWRESEDRYRQGLDRLLGAIELALKGESRFRAWDDRLRPWDFAAFLNEKREGFCGREWLFDEIDAWRVAQRERALLVTGDPGTGKSAIVAELVHRNPGGQVLAYHCCQADTRETLQPGRFVRSLAAMIASKLDAYAALLMSEPAVDEALSEANCARDPASAFEAGLLAPLATLPAPAEGVRYLLVDALDEALTLREGISIVDVLAARLERLPPWLRVVATTRKERGVLDRLRGLRAQELDAQDPRNLEDVDRYVATRLDQPNLAECLAHARMRPAEALRLLRRRSGGNFLYVREALQGIERGLYGLDRLDELPPGLHGLYLRFFERHFPDEASYAPARRVLQVVVAAAEPLAEDQIARATGLDVEDELPRVLRTLASYLPARGGRFEVYHKSFADWLADPELRGTLHHVGRRRGHERLAELGLAEYLRDARTISRYALAHLPRHLREAGRLDDLADVLLDLPFLEAKAEAGLVFDLADDLTAAVAALPAGHPKAELVRLVEEAVRADIHLVARHPTTLFQCLWNRCWWYDCPDAAAYHDPPEGGWSAAGPPWSRPGPRLFALLEAWRAEKARRAPGFAWVRSLRPPAVCLGTAQRAVLRGHETGVARAIVSSDGRLIASCSDYDHSLSSDMLLRRDLEGWSVWLWDAASGRALYSLRGDRAQVTDLAFSPDGRRLAGTLSSWPRMALVWDTASGEEVARLVVRDEYSRGFTAAAFSPDGKTLALGDSDGKVRLWDPDGPSQPAPEVDPVTRVGWKSPGDPEPILCLAFSPDGKTLATGDMDRRIRVWDVRSLREVACPRPHDDWVTFVAFRPDGRGILSGSLDGTIRSWNPATGAAVTLFASDRPAPQTGDVRHGHTGFNLPMEGGVRYRRVRARGIHAADLSPDGRRLAVALFDRSIRIIGLEPGAGSLTLRGHDRVIMDVAFHPDGRHVVSCSLDKTIRLWDSAGNPEFARVRGNDEPFHRVDFTPDGGRLLAEADGKALRGFDAESGRDLGPLGPGDKASRARQRALQFPLRAFNRILETEIELADQRRPVAWFAPGLRAVRKHPSRPTWAGIDAGVLHLVTLEGEVPGLAGARPLAPVGGQGGPPRVWDYCPACGLLVPADHPGTHCPACHALLGRHDETCGDCDTCGEMVPTFNYCIYCGAKRGVGR